VKIVFIDFETYYDQQYSLSKITTEAYIRSPQFEVIGVSIKVGAEPTQWFTGTDEEIKGLLLSLDLHECMMVAHNTLFDGAILSWHYGIQPKAYGDTMGMARAWLGTERSASLRAVAEHYGIGEKGYEVENAKGKRRRDFTDEEMDRYGAYCIKDVDLTAGVFHAMRREGFPTAELKVIDMTLRMFAEPILALDTCSLATHRDNIARQKQELLDNAGIKDKKDLMSNNKFAELLRDRGIEPPMKISPTTGKETYAFAKSDQEFLALQDHEDPEIATLVATRLGVKSTLEETRTERFLSIASRGLFPVPLRYYGAHTGRWSGCLTGDTIITVLEDGATAPRDKALEDVKDTDRIWDGAEFVTHRGVVFSGEQEVMTWDGVRGTPDHVVFTSEGEMTLAEAAHAGIGILQGGYDGHEPTGA
jgi:DNA polymerase